MGVSSAMAHVPFQRLMASAVRALRPRPRGGRYPGRCSPPGPADHGSPRTIAQHNHRDTSLGLLKGALRLMAARMWNEGAPLRAASRGARQGPPADAIKRWKGTCAIAELTPIIG